ncbi:MAG: Maf-like protein, partial [Pseudomonadota bacterium]
MHEPTSSPRLILASTSPYRKELLSRLGIPFEVCNPQTNETPFPNEAPESLALRLAEAKARAVSSTHPDSLI